MQPHLSPASINSPTTAQHETFPALVLLVCCIGAPTRAQQCAHAPQHSLSVVAMQVWTQDENSAAPLPARKLDATAFPGPPKLLPGPSVRKALGNITNQQGMRTPGAALGPRKALGDSVSATSAAPVPEWRKGADARQAARSAAAVCAAGAPESPEALAGMGWRELEAARHAQTSAEISARLAAIAAVPSFNPFFRQARSAAPSSLCPRVQQCICEAQLTSIPDCTRPGRVARKRARGLRRMCAPAVASGLASKGAAR